MIIQNFSSTRGGERRGEGDADERIRIYIWSVVREDIGGVEKLNKNKGVRAIHNEGNKQALITTRIKSPRTSDNGISEWLL